MPHSEAESKVFIEECRYALEKLFQTLEQELQTSKTIKEELSRELAKVEQVEQAKQYLDSIFIEEEQWSVNANYYYFRYMDKIHALTEEKEKILQQLQDIQERAKELRVRSGASEESIAILASAVLQIAKQCLSFRFGSRQNLPLESARQIGNQSVVEVIWEGRNHGMHWEEEEEDKNKKPSKPRERVDNMLQKLKKDKGVHIIEGKNNAFVILEVLDWKDTNKVIEELKEIISLNVT